MLLKVRPLSLIFSSPVVGDEYYISVQTGWYWKAEVVLINTVGEIAGHVWDDELEEQIQILLAD